MAFNFVDMLWIAAIGNSLLALYAAALALIASRTVKLLRMKSW